MLQSCQTGSEGGPQPEGVCCLSCQLLKLTEPSDLALLYFEISIFLSRYINIILINLRAINTNAFSLIFLSVTPLSHMYLFPSVLVIQNKLFF